MKRLHVLEAEDAGLLDDSLNARVVRELVFADRSVAELSKKLDVPMVKMWRRIAKLTRAGVIEQTGSKRIRNLESKVYRARAPKYVSKRALDLEPRGKAVREAYALYSDIQQDISKALSRFEEVPERLDPADFAAFADMHAFCRVLLHPDTRQKLLVLREKLSRMEGLSDLAEPWGRSMGAV
ncbi:MAG: helix-turn-helix transcriptional regulator [Nitrososphaerota archaeon]|nr:helix-turn-helix transcriptional regulator [Nitrososphaerota archaeon]